jgi:hypothetical protein
LLPDTQKRCRQRQCSKEFTINFKIALDGYGSTVI